MVAALINCFVRILKVLLCVLFQGRGERAYDIYSRLLRERIICLMGPVSVKIKEIYFVHVFKGIL